MSRLVDFVPQSGLPPAERQFQTGDYIIRPASAADREAILATHNLVFGEAMADFQPRTTREWDWAFIDNPAGTNIWIAEKDGEVCAQYAGIPIRIRAGGKNVVFSHIVDSFTHPDHRRGLKRPGLFAYTANAFIDALLWPERVSLLYGFPLPEAYRLGAKLIGYEVVRTITQLWMLLEHDLPASSEPEPTVEVVTRFDEDVSELFERCVRADDHFAVRDAAYLNWRYADHPLGGYELAVVRGPEGLRGAAVYRSGSFSSVPQGLLMDWLVPENDNAAGRALFAWCRERARAEGFDRLGTMLAPCDPWWKGLQQFGMKVVPTRYQLVSGMLRRDHRFYEDQSRAEWRYTLGETDLA